MSMWYTYSWWNLSIRDFLFDFEFEETRDIPHIAFHLLQTEIKPLAQEDFES